MKDLIRGALAGAAAAQAAADGLQPLICRRHSLIRRILGARHGEAQPSPQCDRAKARDPFYIVDRRVNPTAILWTYKLRLGFSTRGLVRENLTAIRRSFRFESYSLPACGLKN